MSTKCPKCGSDNTALVNYTPKYSNGKKIAAAGGAIGIAVIGAFVAGPIGAFAGGAIGKFIGNGLQNMATDNSGAKSMHCKSCNHYWTE